MSKKKRSKYEELVHIAKNEGKEKPFETLEHLHGKPKTRRDFLSTGLLQFAAAITVPSLIETLAMSNMAQAQELICPKGGTAGLIPHITLNLSGGAGLSANFVPMDAGGQPLPSYDRMGLGDGNVPLVRDFNDVPFAGNGISQFYQGLVDNTSVITRSKTAFIGVNFQSQDDSPMNKIDSTGLVLQAGAKGKILPNLGRTKNQPAFIQPNPPLNVRNYNDIVSALGVSDSLDRLSQVQQENLFKMVRNLSNSQTRKLAGTTGGKVLSNLNFCSNQQNAEIILAGTSTVDPLQNPGLAAIWGINQNTNRGSREFVFSSVVYNALNQNAGPVQLEMGGYDYHNGTRTTGDGRDNEAGTVIGRILESADLLGQKCFVQVTTDGSVTSPISQARNAPWTSDRGRAGCAYMIAYDPLKRADTTGFQLGHFTNGQAAALDSVAGGNPELATAAMFANYLSFCNRIDLLEQVLPGVFDTAKLDKIRMIFGATIGV